MNFQVNLNSSSLMTNVTKTKEAPQYGNLVGWRVCVKEGSIKNENFCKIST